MSISESVRRNESESLKRRKLADKFSTSNQSIACTNPTRLSSKGNSRALNILVSKCGEQRKKRRERNCERREEAIESKLGVPLQRT